MEVELKKWTIFLLYTLFIIVISLNASVAFASYNATLSWKAPTTNADGTPLDDLAGYYVYYGTQSQNYDHKNKVGNVKTYTVANLADGDPYYCAVTAYDTSGNESKPSNEVSIIRYTLTVNKSGTGEGTVTSSPSGINCGSDCKEAYKSGTVVTLSATADTGSNFTGWSGGGCEGNGQCVVTINATKTVTANFAAV
ncbi:MAG: fibronectin type III domain-containing protein, partial [Nitrospirota bacterium]